MPKKKKKSKASRKHLSWKEMRKLANHIFGVKERHRGEEEHKEYIDKVQG